MRSEPDRALALDCLKLADCNGASAECAKSVVERAARYYDFVTGSDTDDAKAMLEAVRAAVSQP